MIKVLISLNELMDLCNKAANPYFGSPSKLCEDWFLEQISMQNKWIKIDENDHATLPKIDVRIWAKRANGQIVYAYRSYKDEWVEDDGSMDHHAFHALENSDAYSIYADNRNIVTHWCYTHRQPANGEENDI